MEFLKKFIPFILIAASTSSSEYSEDNYKISGESAIENLETRDNLLDITGSEELENVVEIPRPTRYFYFLRDQFKLYKKLKSSDIETVKKFGNRSHHAGDTHRRYQSWAPFSIESNAGSHSTEISFLQELPRYRYGNISASQITLTLRNDMAGKSFSNRTFIRMWGSWEKQEHGKDGVMINVTKHVSFSRQIFHNASFYSFDITELLNHSIVPEIVPPTYINFTFDLFELIDNAPVKFIDLPDLFDVNETSIILFFTDFIPTEANARKMRIRRSLNREEYIPSHRCQRVPFTITPTELLWYSTVLNPEEFDLGMCTGYCPFPLEDQSYNFTLHTFLMDRIRHQGLVQLPDEFPHSKCTPIAYKEVEVIEMERGSRYLMRDDVIKDLSVAQCGCR